jgi:hypothetical protein
MHREEIALRDQEDTEDRRGASLASLMEQLTLLTLQLGSEGLDRPNEITEVMARCRNLFLELQQAVAKLRAEGLHESMGKDFSEWLVALAAATESTCRRLNVRRDQVEKSLHELRKKQRALKAYRFS